MPMQIRPYLAERDFDRIRTWISDARTHAMWCANRFSFPLSQADFEAVLQAHSAQYGDMPFTAADASGSAVGFFCFSASADFGEAMLKFVAVDSSLRGQGIGTEMVRHAVKYIFENTRADAVQLMVFSGNAAAEKCYRNAGFTVRSVTPQVFRFGDETWDRCNMVINRAAFEQLSLPQQLGLARDSFFQEMHEECGVRLPFSGEQDW